jgi:hypothetical protein
MIILFTIGRVLLFLVGFAVVIRTLASAVRVFVLPRAVTDPMARWMFLRMRLVFSRVARRFDTYERIDAVWAFFGPVSLLMILVMWEITIVAGYMFMFLAVGSSSGPWQDVLRSAFTISGSSILTLGFAPPTTMPQTLLALTEAMIGLILVALLIAYLPTIYGAWSRRETALTLLETRAGTPPTPAEMLIRYHRLAHLERLNDVWTQWEIWFAEVEESHTSLSSVALFRSAHPDRSWVVAAGAVLDAAALYSTVLDIPREPQAEVTIRTGYICLRRIAAFFQLPFDPDPSPSDPISVTREEFDEVFDQLADEGLPMVTGRDGAWRAFSGWRVNYDVPLLALAGLTLAPPAPWSSDRGIVYPHGPS